MSYQRTTRKHRHLKYMRAKKERVHTGLGHLFRLMRFFRLTGLARVLVRKPWHVADLYVDGQFLRALYIYPKENAAQRLERIMKEAQSRMVKLTRNADVMMSHTATDRTKKRSTR